ncbi:unnamed protein product [Musa acuminata subsp. malaccensis]|uniref:(wild Malaysian banana) hypothetical protein n=1 Tax=Musa acuminata subsp. malaccensis TaxID=214687 RepID=A0A804HP30_MUSAM|nr:unnamed protein product [Musa acuminata subsp. malaccensis]
MLVQEHKGQRLDDGDFNAERRLANQLFTERRRVMRR